MATSVALEQALENCFTHYHSLGFFKAFRKGAQNMPKSGRGEKCSMFKKSINTVQLLRSLQHCLSYAIVYLLHMEYVFFFVRHFYYDLTR